MTTVEFLAHLQSLEVKVWLEGDRVRCRGPEAALTPELQAELKIRRGEIIAYLKAANGSGVAGELPLQPVARNVDLPLSFAQQRQWVLDQLEPGSTAYNLPLAWHLTGLLNIGALEHSLAEIVRRHEVLRTTFSEVDGQPVQIIAPFQLWNLPVVDLQNVSEGERGAEARRQTAAEAQQPFDLTQGPLFRAKLLRLNHEEHVLLLTMNHIVSDGWSMGVLSRELLALYEAFSAGRPSPLSELPIQYADFSVWQQQRLQGDELERHLEYWRKQLAGSSPILELPTDRPRPAVQTFEGGKVPLALSIELTEKLINLSRTEGVTLFITLLAAFKVLLHRYTGQSDISVGTFIANRTRAEIEELIGFFVNTLVLRTDLAGDPTFRELLGREREVCLGAYNHQDVPFEKLLMELQPERNLSHTPLFQVMLVLQNFPKVNQGPSNLIAEPFEGTEGQRSNFDLTVWFSEEADGLNGYLEYNTDLFEAATVRRMTEHFKILLKEIVANPGRGISSFSLLTERERNQLLVNWNDTRVDDGRDFCVHELFEREAALNPDGVAVVFEDQQITYRELNARSNQVAHYLRKIGVGPDVLVAICIEPSISMIVGLIGVLKAGGAYLPLDLRYPADRLTFMLEDSQARMLVTEQPLLQRLGDPKTQVVCLDADGEKLGQESTENLSSGVSSENVAYVIYTSGSTGQPKGVLIPHRAMVNHNLAVANRFGLEANDRVLQFHSISFDAAVEEIFPSLLRGAALVIRNQVLGPDVNFLRFIHQMKLTVVNLPTGFWHHWVQELALADEKLPNSLRLVIVGGDKASREQLKTWQDLVGDPVRWINTYGPTEATIITTVYEPQEDGDDKNIRSEVPIGRPIDNARIYVLDAQLNPVPIGVRGELYIGGLGVARGYLNRPELTAERFIPDPFSDNGAARLYKTGDLARYLADGNVEFLGRYDLQVKIRGFRIEPGEIEAVFDENPAIREAAVVARDDGSGERRLVAYVVPTGSQVPNISELRSFLREKLPEYMVPAAFVVLEALPLTPSGKVDRRALPEPDQNRPVLEKAFVGARSPAEKLLAGIWTDVLKIDRVGIHDNFFDLGGHSLLAVRVASRARDAFQINLPLRTLFENPTIEGLAVAIEDILTRVIENLTEDEAQMLLQEGVDSVEPR